METDNKRIMNGEEPSKDSPSTVTAENSDGLRKLDKWLDANKERVARAQENGKLPYFLKDNEKYAKIKENATTNKKGYKRGRAERKEAYEYYKDDKKTELKKEQKENAKMAADALGVKYDDTMSFNEADNGNANPNFSKK